MGLRTPLSRSSGKNSSWREHDVYLLSVFALVQGPISRKPFVQRLFLQSSTRCELGSPFLLYHLGEEQILTAHHASKTSSGGPSAFPRPDSYVPTWHETTDGGVGGQDIDCALIV
eukprot:1180734-Prorocentrum_minimum.AAC.4